MGVTATGPAVEAACDAPYFLAAARGQAELEDLDDNAAASVRAVAGEPERDLPTLAGRIVHGCCAAEFGVVGPRAPVEVVRSHDGPGVVDGAPTRHTLARWRFRRACARRLR